VGEFTGFYGAGMETTAGLCNAAIYFLATNPKAY